MTTGVAFFGAEELVNFALLQPPLTPTEVLALLPLYVVVPGLVGAIAGARTRDPLPVCAWIWTGTATFLLGGRLCFQLAERTLPAWPGFGVALVLCGGAMVATRVLLRNREALQWGALAGAWLVTALGLVANLNALGSAFSGTALLVDLAVLALGALLALGLGWFLRARDPRPLRSISILAVLFWILRLPLPALVVPGYPDPAPAREAPPILLVVIDTLRADRLSAYGQVRDLTPNLDRLADRGWVYQQPMSGAGWTLPGFASILTGLAPDHHGAGVNNGSRNLGTGLRSGSQTLPGLLKEAGYTTGAIVTNAWLKRLFGLDQGFDYYDDALGLGHMPLILQPLDQVGLTLLPDRSYTPANRQADKALAFLAAQGEGAWFLMLHFMDPHGPYNPPERHLEGLPEDYADPIERLYDAEIRFADEQLGRVLEALPKNAWVVVTADHGEEFGEHPDAYPGEPIPPGTRHGHSVYEELVRVPLLVATGAGSPGASVTRAVRTVDILPTLLKVASQPIPQGLDGLPLYEALGQPVEDPVAPWPSVAAAIRYGQERKALRLWPWKYIQGEDHEELYNLANDPGEQVDLLSREVPETGDGPMPHDRARQMARLLDSEPRVEIPDDAPEIDPRTEQQLRELGYIE